MVQNLDEAERSDIGNDIDSKKIEKFLTKHPDGVSAYKIERESGAKQRRVKDLLKGLMIQGRVEECKIVTGNRRTPQDGGYRLRTADSVTTNNSEVAA